MLEKDLETLSRDKLQKIVLKMEEFLSEKQLQKMQEIVQDCSRTYEKDQTETMQVRMSQEYKRKFPRHSSFQREMKHNFNRV